MKQYEIYKVHENCYFIMEAGGEKDRYIAQVWNEKDCAMIINALNKGDHKGQYDRN